MKTKSTIKLFATAILATSTIGANTIYADAQINRDTANDSVEIISDPYKTYEEADKALNDVKDKYLEEYGSYRAGVNPTEDLKHYEVYSVLYAVSTDQTSESTVQNVAKALSHSQSTPEPEKPAPTPVPEKPAPTPESEKPAPTPVPEKPAPTPEPEKPAPTPEPEKPAPTPVPEKPAPTPVPEKPAPTPESEKPAPTPVPEKPAPTPEPEKPTKTTDRVKDDKTKTDDSKKDSQNNETTKNKLPETGESSSLLGVIGGLLSIVGLGIFTKCKRG